METSDRCLNRPGAGGLIAAQAAAGVEKDGYTLYVTQASTFTVLPITQEGKMPVDLQGLGHRGLRGRSQRREKFRNRIASFGRKRWVRRRDRDHHFHRRCAQLRSRTALLERHDLRHRRLVGVVGLLLFDRRIETALE